MATNKNRKKTFKQKKKAKRIQKQKALKKANKITQKQATTKSEEFKKLGFEGSVFKKGNKEYTDKAKKFLKTEVIIRKRGGDLVPKGKVFNLHNGRITDDNKVFTKEGNLNKKLKPGFKHNNVLDTIYNNSDDLFISSDIRIRFKRRNKNGTEDIFEQRYNVSDHKEDTELPYNFNTKDWIKQTRMDIASRFDYQNDGTNLEGIELENVKLHTSPKNKIALNNIKLKLLKFNIDGMNLQEWDKEKGSCVFDFINWYYKDCKRGTKKFSDETYFDMIYGDSWRKDGINTNQILSWCEKAKVNMIALDKDEKEVLLHQCKEGKKKKNLVFIIHNDHFYAFTNRSKITSLSHIHFDKNSKLTSKNKIKEIKEKKEEEYKDYKVKIIGEKELNGMTGLEWMFKNMIKNKLEPKNKNIKWCNMKLESFIQDDLKERYIFHDKINDGLKQYIEHKGDQYKGEKFSNIVFNAMDDFEIKTSKPNKKINELFLTENFKDLVHNGFWGEKQSLENLHTYDIKKCHTSILKDSEEDWLIFDFSCELEDWNGGEILPGLYYIETKDRKLFVGNKFYSSSAIQLGLDEGLITHNDIKKVIKPSSTLPRDYYYNLLESYKLSLDETNPHYNAVLKLLNNCTSGILGKTEFHSIIRKVSTSYEEAWQWLYENGYENGYKKLNPVKIEDSEFWIYGNEISSESKYHNLPQYVQILTQQLIKMYKGVKSMTNNNWSRLVYRKIDSISIKGDASSDEWIGKKEGIFKIDKTPTYITNHFYKDIKVDWSKYKKEWKKDNNIKYSYEYEKVFDYIENKKSLCVIASAGLGKTYIIDKVVKKYGKENVVCMAFSNCASRRIDGETINHFLNVSFDKDNGNLNKSKIKSIINNKNLKCILIDEQGTIPGYLWHLINEMKLKIDIPIISFGDFHQIINAEGKRYNNHSIIKNICDFNIIKLEWHDKCRHSKEFFDNLEMIRNGEKMEGFKDLKKSPASSLEEDKKINKRKITDFDIHICHTNKKCNEINKICSNASDKKKYRIEDYFNLNNRSELYENFNLDIELPFIDFIFEGMPIMCVKNNYEKEWYNGERFKIKSIKKGNLNPLLIGKTIPNNKEELSDLFINLGEKYNTKKLFKTNLKEFFIKYFINEQMKIDIGDHIISLYDFVNDFEVAFAMTNHKVIGDTIQEDYCVHQADFYYSDRYWLYTSLSRASSKSMIHLS